MNMLSVAQAQRLYEFSREIRIDYHRIRYDELRTFCRLCILFARRISESGDEEAWKEFSQPLRRYRFTLLSTPCAANASGPVARLSLASLEQFLEHSRLAMSATHLGMARQLLGMAGSLATRTENPILDCIESICLSAARGRTVVMVRDSRSIIDTEKSLSSRRATMDCDVITAGAHRAVGQYDRLIVIGPVRWFPTHIFAAPRTAMIDSATYAWNADRWKADALFTGSRRSARELPAPAADVVIEEPWPEIDWGTVASRGAVAFADQTSNDGHELVDAYLFSLHGGEAVFLEQDSSALVIDLEEDESCRVRRVDTREIEPAMFLLLRTEGGGDYVVPLADRLLGSTAKQLRSVQRSWKDKLRVEARRLGLFEASVRLLDLGSKRANESNLRNWMSARSIRPQDEKDFGAIMKLIGLGQDTDRNWRMMGELQGAHQRAGQLIRRRLLQQVAAADLAALEKAARVEFHLPEAEGGKLAAHRVEGRAPSTTLVPPSRCNRPFPADD